MFKRFRKAIKGDLVRDYGLVYAWREQEESLFLAEFAKVGECRLEFTMAPDRMSDRLRWMAPGMLLSGERSELVDGLRRALELIDDGGSVPEPPKARGKSITLGVFNRGVSNLRLVFVHAELLGHTRTYVAEKAGQPVLLVIKDDWDDPRDGCLMKMLDWIIADRAERQESLQWPVGALEAVVGVLRQPPELE